MNIRENVVAGTVPCSRKFSWEKIFANSRPLVKILFAKIEHCRCGHWAFSNSQNFSEKSYFETIRENFPLYGNILKVTLLALENCPLHASPLFPFSFPRVQIQYDFTGVPFLGNIIDYLPSLDLSSSMTFIPGRQFGFYCFFCLSPCGITIYFRLIFSHNFVTLFVNLTYCISNLSFTVVQLLII